MSTKNYPRQSRLRVAFMAGSAVLISLTSARADDYKLYSGDTLEFSLAWQPESRQVVTINNDGDIYLPVVGQVKAGGFSLSQLNQNLKKLISTKVVQRRGVDGNTYATVIDQSDVLINVKEYRPIYLQGQIFKPGEQAFRPGMTVRQAIANAGGYEFFPQRAKASDPEAQIIKTKFELNSSLTDLANSMALVWGLEVEAGLANIKNPPLLNDIPISSDLKDRFIANAKSEIDLRKSALENERTYLSTVIAQTDKRLSLLRQQQKSEEEESANDASDYQRLSAIFEKGNTSQLRVTDARRVMLLSATRVLQTSAAVALAAKEQEQNKKDLQNIDTKRRIEILELLQKQRVIIANTQLKISSLRKQLEYATSGAFGAGADPNTNVKILVYRMSSEGKRVVQADLDSSLDPGDVVVTTLLTTRNFD